MSDLPVNIDTTYADDGGDASVKTHQQHHDALHDFYNWGRTGQYPVNTVATSGAAETLPATHSAHKVTMDQNCTFTFTSPTQTGHTFLLWLLGAFTPTFPASVDWHGGAAPTYADDSLYGFTTLDGGTTWIGQLVASGLA